MRWIISFFMLTIAIQLNAQQLDMELKNLDGEWINIETLKGEELTVIDFWATWCKPCVNAIPKINKLSQQFSEGKVSFIGVNVDGPRNLAKVNPFVQSMRLQYSIVLDTDQELLTELNATVLPTLLILNKKNKEVYRHEGFQAGDEKLIEEKINELLSHEN